MLSRSPLAARQPAPRLPTADCQLTLQQHRLDCKSTPSTTPLTCATLHRTCNLLLPACLTLPSAFLNQDISSQTHQSSHSNQNVPQVSSLSFSSCLPSSRPTTPPPNSSWQATPLPAYFVCWYSLQRTRTAEITGANVHSSAAQVSAGFGAGQPCFHSSHSCVRAVRFPHPVAFVGCRRVLGCTVARRSAHCSGAVAAAVPR